MCAKAHSIANRFLVRHLFLPEPASPLMIDSTAILVPVYLRPKFPSAIAAWSSVGIPHPPLRLVVKYASLTPKKSIYSGTHSELPQRIPWRMTTLALKSWADFCGA